MSTEPKAPKSAETKIPLKDAKLEKATSEVSKLEEATVLEPALKTAEPAEVAKTAQKPETERKPRRRGWWSRG